MNEIDNVKIQEGISRLRDYIFSFLNGKIQGCQPGRYDLNLIKDIDGIKRPPSIYEEPLNKNIDLPIFKDKDFTVYLNGNRRDMVISYKKNSNHHNIIFRDTISDSIWFSSNELIKFYLYVTDLTIKFYFKEMYNTELEIDKTKTI